MTQLQSSEPIPGYRLVERIGAGGYGEVWKVEAPGGLVKALKLVYGQLDEDRASRELKALQRIKDVRHPFLLSLERIEVVDGRLMILTELAEKSLKDHFDECREAGECGISEQELISHMSDSADVLDYMSESYDLQHLDIKPENLLLVGGRVKVADFGLVKKLQDVSVSLMGGLTPLYAPPELFDGRPSRWSDQYSLAIVYQEMLTAVLPFPGKSAAQLASQHMHAPPRLTVLPASQRPVLAKALSKDPTARFSSCREFVTALRAAAAGGAMSRAVVVPDLSAVEQSPTECRSSRIRPTSVIENSSAAAARAQPIGPAKHRMPAIVEQPELIDVPGDSERRQARFRPTLFVGIGGTGCRVVAHLSSRAARFPGHDGCPPLHRCLLIDTDVVDLTHVTDRHSHDDATDWTVIPVPVRSAKSYKARNNSSGWLSRRWLYHIPKQPSTNHLRPLGRLAIVDHQASVLEQIKLQWAQLQEDLELQDNPLSPQVVVVASLAGGTGGGMFIDASYLVAEAVMDGGGSLDDITHVLLHSSPHEAKLRELALVSTYAGLVELHHELDAGTRPSQLVATSCDTAPFSRTYFVPLGDCLGNTQYEEAVDAVARYLHVGLLCSADARPKDARPSDSTKRRAASLRSFGAKSLGLTDETTIDAWSDRVCQGLIELWLTGNAPGDSSEPGVRERISGAVTRSTRGRETEFAHEQPWYDAVWKKFELSPGQMISRVEHWIEEILEEPAKDFLDREVARIAAADKESPAERAEAVAALLDHLVGSESTSNEIGSSTHGLSLLEKRLLSRKHSWFSAVETPLHSVLINMVAAPEFRVAGAHRLVDGCRDRLREITDQMRREQAAIDHQVSAARTAIAETTSSSKSRPGEVDRERLSEYANLRFRRFVFAIVVDVVGKLEALLSETRDELVTLARDLRSIHGRFKAGDAAGAQADFGGDGDHAVCVTARRVSWRRLEKVYARLVEQLDRIVTSEFSDPPGSWVRALLEPDESSRVVDRLRHHARELVSGALSPKELFRDLMAELADPEEAINMLWQRAAPALIACGGTRKSLLFVPNHADSVPECLKGRPPHRTHVAVPFCCDVILASEQSEIPITEAAVRLIEGRQDRLDYAYRLLTRTDVRWRALPDTATPPA